MGTPLFTTALTVLNLTIMGTSPSPTTSQLLSILVSNPRLRNLTLSGRVTPHDNDDGSALRVALHHSRDFYPIFRSVRRLDHPQNNG